MEIIVFNNTNTLCAASPQKGGIEGIDYEDWED